MIHIGSVRTALFSWLLARKQNGKFLLRIEDTDRARSSGEFTSLILETLDWLGMAPDEPPVFQSDRTESYRLRASQLVEAGSAYHCTCSRERLDELRKSQQKQGIKPRYDHRCRNLGIEPETDVESVIRFKNPLQGEVVVDDIVQGRVSYRNSELDDLIIIRSDGSPTYNFSVVVDELSMGITHVLRGDDHLNNTPRQINLYRAFGAGLPQFGHVPMVLSAQGRKISKRDNPPNVLEYRNRGYLPEAILNYLVRLGWSHGDQEIFSIDEMIALFSAEQIHKSPASMDEKKLQWLNHQHIMSADVRRIAELAKPVFVSRGINTDTSDADLVELIEVQKARSKTLVEFVERSMYFYKEFEEFDPAAARKHLTSESGRLLAQLRDALEELKDWKKERIHDAVGKVAERNGVKFGAIAQPARVALTGGTVSPGIDVTIELIGRAGVRQRFDRALAWIGEHHANIE